MLSQEEANNIIASSLFVTILIHFNLALTSSFISSLLPFIFRLIIIFGNMYPKHNQNQDSDCKRYCSNSLLMPSYSSDINRQQKKSACYHSKMTSGLLGKTVHYAHTALNKLNAIVESKSSNRINKTKIKKSLSLPMDLKIHQIKLKDQ